MRVQKWHCYLQLLPLQLVQLVLACCSCAVRVRQCRLCIPGLKRTACGDPLSWTQPDLVIPGRPDRKGAVAPDVWCTASHFKSENKKKGSENTKSRSKFEVTVTWMDEIFDSKRIQAMRIHITSYHYEPFKGPDGLLSPRMVSSSAFHLRPDCQCLTEKTTPHGFCRWSFLSHGHQVWGFNSKLKIFLNFSEGFCIFFLFSWQRANRLT